MSRTHFLVFFFVIKVSGFFLMKEAEQCNVNLLRKSTALLAALVLAAMVSSVFAADAHSHAVVTAAVANMYSSPSENSDVVSQAILGSNVVRLKKKHKWLQIQTSDNYTGWVRKNVVRDENGADYAAGSDSAEVTSLFANVYRETDVTKHAPIAVLPFEARLEVSDKGTEANGRWLQVRLPDGRSGWIQRGDISMTTRLLSIPESIELAKRFLGIPYLWGGRSSFGYDCSGFTQMILRSRGIFMPRDADQQAAWSGVVPVERKNLQPGDLLFFGSSPDKITHTGMYIGAGEFIHDTTHAHPVVQISRLDDEPWTHLLVAMRRAK